MVQAAGYIKYLVAQKNNQNVYYRGQSQIYTELLPSLYRGVGTPAGRSAKTESLNKLVANLKKSEGIFKNMPDLVVEPLLQHYGIQTTWLDLVDNIWVALWFACYKSVSAGKDNKYLNFEKRVERRENDDKRYAYIYLISTDLANAAVVHPGVWKGSKTELVDLRLAAPSIFLRPHAQHGLLFRNLGIPGGRAPDYSSSIAGILRINLSDALEWLGDGRLLDTHSLFPPATYDNGYRILLESQSIFEVDIKLSIGTINYLGT
nr:FRG domain-containing protein [Deinococcus betulae]